MWQRIIIYVSIHIGLLLCLNGCFRWQEQPASWKAQWQQIEDSVNDVAPWAQLNLISARAVPDTHCQVHEMRVVFWVDPQRELWVWFHDNAIEQTLRVEWEATEGPSPDQQEQQDWQWALPQVQVNAAEAIATTEELGAEFATTQETIVGCPWALLSASNREVPNRPAWRVVYVGESAFLEVLVDATTGQVIHQEVTLVSKNDKQ
ncbi:MAG: hypothetical protein GFH24_608350n111 [Chloroflexi bacterium AL-N5]|nr:hypothetical protein [Chloroflexi bacterium AL-N5]